MIIINSYNQIGGSDSIITAHFGTCQPTPFTNNYQVNTRYDAKTTQTLTNFSDIMEHLLHLQCDTYLDYSCSSGDIDCGDNQIYTNDNSKLINKEVFLTTCNQYCTILETIDGKYCIHNDYVKKKIITDDSTVIMIGDLHCSLYSLLEIIKDLQYKRYIDTRLKLKDNVYLIFLGDLIDRGPFGIEILYITMQLFINNPNNIIIVKGNHETPDIYNHYGFNKELANSFNLTDDENKIINKSIIAKPVALFVKYNTDNKW